ncbi:MAG: hypothetical protein ACF8XB_16760 [Planctomycetota bacterium JB042]
MAPGRLDLPERLRLRVVELLVLVAVGFIVARVALPRSTGARVLAREARVLDTLRAIHEAERDAVAAGGTRWLSELVTAAPPASPLRLLERRPPVADVELFERDDYLFALHVLDSGRSDDRAWSEGMATGTERPPAYAAFAWPLRYGRDAQWAFFIDQRGKLLGSWNHAGLFDGTEEPFPPAAHPLRDHLSAKKEGEDSEWFLFDELEEIVPPAEPAGG